MSTTIQNAKTLRGKIRRAQADADAATYVASNRFNGCSTKRVCDNKNRGAHHKKLFMERTTKTFARYSNA